jgi:hypothetical protein
MRKVPDGLHRERIGGARPAVWYAVWLGEPHAEGSVILGRTRRLDRHLMHRAFPEDGTTRPKEIKGWVEAASWLLEVSRGGVPG